MKDRKKMRYLAQRVEQYTQGKQQPCNHKSTGLYIKACDHALTSLILSSQQRQEHLKERRLALKASVEKIENLDSNAMYQFANEAREIAKLLEEFEEELIITEEEMLNYSEELQRQRQHEQSLTMGSV